MMRTTSPLSRGLLRQLALVSPAQGGTRAAAISTCAAAARPRADATRPPAIAAFQPLQTRNKSRKSSAQYIDEDAAADDDVPVMHTKGKKSKGAKGSSNAPRGAKSKRGDAEANDTSKGAPAYKTSVRNQDLPDEAFDFDALTENMKRAVERCRQTVSTLVGSLGRADPALLDSVKVEYPGTSGAAKTSHPLRDFATVGVRDGSLIVNCFDADMVKHVERGIYAADLGLTPQTQAGEDENIIRVPIPKPTTETRQAMVKDVTRICENARVSIRSARHSAQKQIKSDIDRKVIGKSEGDKEMKSIETETKKHSAEVDALFEKTKKNLLSTV
ncbi:uncharacterized protein PFL1_00218 [Pseudozyma flocculosa PF-1]|uniref:Ribosome recycling factor domain-containing protein n=1 Tax=Pseudozyma flocculosa TaxID=84751 RepID=A0A5C3ERW6_9BASI|nr:uncharacterized protein PFL1_00218 [Pseudozyma flocculosa PF-1]EPQ32020.1 hypothetical protein PFL1_00218 [Pseudozyma flocculosa PF-1]SPO35054.1 uncharacterized protein PSFLO_00525 [Pseudozyma flocculosa]